MEEKEKVYCKDCRFLRYSIKEKEEDKNFQLFSTKETTFICAAPANLLRCTNFMEPIWKLRHKEQPQFKNYYNNCSDFETIEQAISQK